MVRIKSEFSTPRLQTPGTGGSTRGKGGRGAGGGSNNNNNDNGNQRSGGVHPALMLSNAKMRDILRCDDADLDMLKHATYKVMKTQSGIHRQALRVALSAQEPEFASMLSGERWEGEQYPQGRTFEGDIDSLLIKIMSIARRRLKGEAKKIKAADEDEGYASSLLGTRTPSTSVRNPPTTPLIGQTRDDRNGLVSEDDEEVVTEQDYAMSGGLARDDDVFRPVRNPMQSPEPDDFIRGASTPRKSRRAQASDSVFSTPSKAGNRSGRRELRVNRQKVTREVTRAFGEQDVIVLD